ncbi:DNA cytosine methyltransferase [Pseudoclavibacter albus]|uniref:DNA cytosine methyltransferase n=1 Tax=Pseudoclavibacter albus TaxID=272241 RepID=UPI0035CCCF7D
MARLGELFAGYGGLGMGVEAALGPMERVWVSEFDPAPSRVLAHHWPAVPNLGDVTKVDWSQVESVDVLTGGFPCQDVSLAGRRAGLSEGTRSGLWAYMRDAIAALRPRLVVIENVRGLLSAQAGGSDVLGQCEFCVASGGVMLCGHLVPFSETWPTSGSMRSGRCFLRPGLVPRIGGSGVSSSPGLPTPRAARGASATEAMRQLPTPTATYSGNTAEEHLRKKPGRSTVTDLRILVEEVGL